MAQVVGIREMQRAASEAAILDAAWDRVACAGPDGAALRSVCDDAGCNHALVARYFGSKAGLVAAVGDRLTRRVHDAVESASATGDPVLALLTTARAHRKDTQLLVRCALGDLDPSGFPACLAAAASIVRPTPRGTRRHDRRARVCAYGAASLVLGWLTFEGFVVAGTRLGAVSPRRRDAAIAVSAAHIARLADAPAPRLVPRSLSGAVSPSAPAREEPSPARTALLAAAIDLFARSGPASVSVRDIAHHAGVNQGLIYRHFGSKGALLAEAIEAGSSGLFPAANATAGFDFDAMSQLMHHGSPAPWLIARTLVDDIDIGTVRTQFPVLERLLGTYREVPSGARPANRSDPRIAVAAAAALALGSVVWGPHLRTTFALTEDDGIESAVADLARDITDWPRGTQGANA